MPTPLDSELAELAAAAAAGAVGASFCGVDIIRGRDRQPYVLEVNSMPAWSGLQTVSTVKIADILAERFSAVLRQRSRTAGRVSAACRPDDIAEAYRLACLDELRAPKAGNVHDFSDGHGMTVGDFEISAEVTKDWIARPGARSASACAARSRATRKAVDCNTNLGIVLMSAPIACAAEREGRGRSPALRSAGCSTRSTSTTPRTCFEAIVLAEPAGLGERPENDVRAPADRHPARGHADGARIATGSPGTMRTASPTSSTSASRRSGARSRSGTTGAGRPPPCISP